MGSGRMRLMRWTPLRKGALHRFATVKLPIGFEIIDCPVLTSHGKTWAIPPGKARIDHDGRLRRDGAGSPLYVVALNGRSRELPEIFSSRVVELLRAYDPDALVDTHA